MNVLDLFSGIGGFSLGLERAGMRTVAFCEIDPFCRRVLDKHWPSVPCHDDITTREFQEGEADIICGGFPCQDISLAGAGAGLAGERSGLWRELLRAIRLVRPRYAIVENVAALLSRGLGVVLGDLAEIGHDAEWHCIPARAAGAPHRRDRVWIVAHPNGSGWPAGQSGAASVGHGHSIGAEGGDVDHAKHPGLQAGRPKGNGDDGSLCGGREHPRHIQTVTDAGGYMADTISAGLEGRPPLAGYLAVELAAIEPDGQVSNTGRDKAERCGSGEREAGERNWWLVEPDVGRVAHGVPARVDRLKGLGNAVVPQIPEIIGRAIMKSHTPHEQ